MIFIGCAGVRKKSDSLERDEVIQKNCARVLNLSKEPDLAGNLWIKASDLKKNSAQFPATAKLSGNSLVMEINNLLGGVEGKVQIENATLFSTFQKSKQTLKNWNGIPVEYGPLLFRGLVPCGSNIHYTFDDQSIGGKVLLSGFELKEGEIKKLECKFESTFWEVSTQTYLAFSCKADTGSELKVRWKDRKS